MAFFARSFDLDLDAAAEVMRAIRWQADDSRIDELTNRWCRDPTSRDVAARMAADAVVIETARSYDLAGLAAALRSAVAGGWLSPTVVAGAGFLARQMLPSGVLADLAPDAVPGARAAGVSAALATCLAAVENCWAASKIG